MTFAELPDMSAYRIRALPNHRLFKCQDGISVTKDFTLFLCRDDVEVIPENEMSASEAEGRE